MSGQVGRYRKLKELTATISHDSDDGEFCTTETKKSICRDIGEQLYKSGLNLQL